MFDAGPAGFTGGINARKYVALTGASKATATRDPRVERGIDTLMLACNHYPLLVPALKKLLPDDVRLVDFATTCAEHLRRELSALDPLATDAGEGKLEVHLTDLSEEFEALARRFLKRGPGRIHRAVLANS